MFFPFSALQENFSQHGLKDHDEDTANLLLSCKGDVIRCEQLSTKMGLSLSEVMWSKLDKPLKWIQLRSQLNEPFEFRMTRTVEGTISVESNVLVSGKSLRILFEMHTIVMPIFCMFQATIDVLQERLGKCLIYVGTNMEVQENVTLDKVFKPEIVDNEEIYPDLWTRLYFTVVGSKYFYFFMGIAS